MKRLLEVELEANSIIQKINVVAIEVSANFFISVMRINNSYGLP